MPGPAFIMNLPLAAKPWLWTAGVLLGLYAAYVLVVGLNQRSFLYFPSHGTGDTPLAPWMVDDQIIGYQRVVTNPRAIWLMTHGNGGQADGRAYVLPHLSPRDSFYVLEYPGYGLRAGQPTKESINHAAAEAYAVLRKIAGKTSVGVIGESLGSGAASFLGTLPQPPDKIVLVVPFDEMAAVAAEHMPLLPVRLLLHDDWNNLAALRRYSGPVEIYGARQDEVIGFAHAQNLAAQLPHARFTPIEGGHNDWSQSPLVRFEP
jgi:hypothetical protein